MTGVEQPGGAVIRCEGLSMRYRSGAGELDVLNGASLFLEPGERVAIVGASGSGKSTFLHLLGGLDRPTGGRVVYDGADIFAMRENERADFRNRRIGFVWQMHSLMPEFSAVENVAMPLLIRGVATAEALAAARQGLYDVGLENRATHRPNQLSGGEQQRVALARALVNHPGVLLADEPTGNLDHATAVAVGDLLAELHRKHRFTLVLVTHNLGLAETCDRILQLEQGTLISWRKEGSGIGASFAERDDRRSRTPTGCIDGKDKYV